MNVTLNKTSNVEGTLAVSIVKADYEDKVVAELKKIRRDANIPGFRKGAVPMGIINKRFNKQVTSDVINKEVYDAVVKYLQDEKLNILGEPLPLTVTELDLDKQTDYTFEYALGFAPEINIEINKEMHLPYYRIEVTPEMMKEQDDMLTGRFGSQEPLEVYADRALIKGTIKELGKDEGYVEKENVIVAPWTFKNKDQEAKFKDAKVGDKIVYNPYEAADGNTAETAAMLSIDRAEAENLKGDFELTITEITGLKKAEHNEEFFKHAFGEQCTTEEQYQESLKKSIEAQLLPNSAALFEAQTRNTLMEKYGNFELPVKFLKDWLVRRNPEQLNADNIDSEFAKSEAAMRWEILSGDIARKLEVKVTEENLMNYAMHAAARQFAQYGMANLDESILKNYAESLLKDENNRRYIVEQVANANLFEAIGNAVTIDDHTVSLDEFKKLAQPINDAAQQAEEAPAE